MTTRSHNHAVMIMGLMVLNAIGLKSESRGCPHFLYFDRMEGWMIFDPKDLGFRTYHLL